MLIKSLHVCFRALYIKGDASRETKAWLEILEKITAVRMTIMSLHYWLLLLWVQFCSTKGDWQADPNIFHNIPETKNIHASYLDWKCSPNCLTGTQNKKFTLEFWDNTASSKKILYILFTGKWWILNRATAHCGRSSSYCG